MNPFGNFAYVLIAAFVIAMAAIAYGTYYENLLFVIIGAVIGLAVIVFTLYSLSNIRWT